MKRRLLNLLTALSLLLCVAAAAVWMRTYFASDYIRHVSLDREGDWVQLAETGIETCRGTLYVVRNLNRFPLSERFDANLFYGWEWERHDPVIGRPWGRNPSILQQLGFVWEHSHHAGSDGAVMRRRVVGGPLWAAVLLLAAVPAARLYRKMRTHPSGHCRSCGYDLRATPGRCPECGGVASVTPSE